MSDPTVRNLITGALRLLGVVQANEVPTAGDIDISLDSLKALIDSYANNRLLVYDVSEEVFVTTGAKTYTMGPGGDIDIERPLNIERAFSRLNGDSMQQVDIPMQSLTYEQYSAISVKNTASTFGFAFYNDSNYPISNLTFFPIPAAGNQISLWLRQPLLNFDNIDEPVSYPPGYERFFRFNLAIELAPEFGVTPSEFVTDNATSSRLTLEQTNSVPRYAVGDGGMIRNGNNRQWNYITGNFWQFGNR